MRVASVIYNNKTKSKFKILINLSWTNLKCTLWLKPHWYMILYENQENQIMVITLKSCPKDGFGQLPVIKARYGWAEHPLLCKCL